MRHPERLLERGDPCWLAVVTEGNGDSKSTYEKGPPLVGSLSLSCLYKRFLSALAGLVSPVQKCFYLPFTISIPLSPSPSKLGRLVSASGDIFNKMVAYFVML